MKEVKEKDQIRKEVSAKINQGEPKQQILEELSKKFKDKISIIKQLEITPSIAMRKKYQLYNYFLAIMLLATLVVDTILIFKLPFAHWTEYITYLNVLLDIILLVGILLYKIENYSWIAARGIISILHITVSSVYYHHAIDKLTFVSLTLVLLSFVLGLFLSVRLCPSRIPKVIEVDIDGVEKVNKTVYVFPD